MEYINRNKSLITGKENLEHLYTFRDFPVFIGTTNEDNVCDLVADMSFSICKDTGFIQLDKVLSLDLIYSGYHSEALGKVWKEHHNQFLDFVSKYDLRNVLEIGGSNGYMARAYTSSNDQAKWIMVEPNPAMESEGNIEVIKSMFDKQFNMPSEIDGVIHSHVFEHMYYPLELMDSISHSSKVGVYHIFSIPNLYSYLERKFTNCMNFEHTTFLTEYFIDYLLAKYGFETLEKKYFENHSIFYATRKVEGKIDFQFESQYTKYKKMFLDYVQHNQEIIDDLNKKILSTDRIVYLFGAHVFSQYLVNQGLLLENIKGILDNSFIKQGQRLYGTDFNVFSPVILEGLERPIVILKAGGYQEEIRRQLLEINPNVEIWE